MKIVLFQVATEFHYLVANSLIEKYYSGNDIQIVFVFSQSSGKNTRLTGLNLQKEYKYFFLDYDHHKQVYNDEVIKFKEFFTTSKIHHFVSFLYHDPFFVYLTYYLKKGGTVSYLAADGMAAYFKFKSSNLRSRYLNSINSYKFYKKLGLKFPKFWFTNWNFGYNGYYDFIFAYSKSLPYIPASKKVIEIDYSFSADSLERLKYAFGVDFSDLGELKKVLLLINYRKSTPKHDVNVISIFNKMFPDRKVIVKSHPDQSADDLKHFENLSNVTILQKVFPIELLIASLEQSVIVSPYSTSLLLYNKSCLYYWTHPVVIADGEMNKPGERFNPKSHINVLKSYSEFKLS